MPLIVLPIFCAYPLFNGIGTNTSRMGIPLDKTIQTENKNSPQNYPDFVQTKSLKAKKLYKNDEGFWEAEFEYGIIMVYIPPGGFQMGSDNRNNNEKSLHSVYLDGYWIGKYEVTFDQYDQYCEDVGIAKPDDEGWGRARYPVINISWLDAMAFCRWLSKKTDNNFMLPTEAQWEKAARGTDGRLYPWGNSLPSDDKANFEKGNANFVKRAKQAESRLIYTTPIGSHPKGSSPYGVLDMAGNVYEWCLDWYSSANSYSSIKMNPRGPKKGDYRVLRGGSWFGGSQCLKTTFRTSAKSSSRYFHIGFRLSME